MSEPLRLFVHRTSSASLRVTIFMSVAGVPDSLVEKVEMGLATDPRGIPVYTLSEGDPVTEALGTTDLKAFNPESRIPVLLLPDGRKMTQSGAIIDYIRTLHDDGGMEPDDPWARAEMRRLMWIIAADVQPYQNIPFIIQAMTEWDMVRAMPTEHPLRLHFIRREFGAIEALLANCAGTCAVGDRVTLADCFIVPQVRNALMAGIDLPNEFPILSRVFDHVTEVPAVRRVLEDAGGKVQPSFFSKAHMEAYAAGDG
ncbi:MAG: glutathione binding-like protein [Paracoccaceae bacterium]|nr:glutathione binding-like protein [Paracoccaceae bacterium]